MKGLRIEKVVKSNREKYLPYLLLADESEEIVLEYINEGDLFAIVFEENCIGTALLLHESSSIIELKNIAVISSFQGKGIGKEAVEYLCKYYKNNGFLKMIVGTANSSIDNIAFYQKAGFRLSYIKRDFFLNYLEPIFENGIQAIDMIMFKKDLGECYEGQNCRMQDETR